MQCKKYTPTSGLRVKKILNTAFNKFNKYQIFTKWELASIITKLLTFKTNI